MNAHPKGWGIFCTRRVYARPAGEVVMAAQRALKARIRNVALLVEAEDGHLPDRDDLLRVATTYKEIASCNVYVYSLPGLHGPNKIEAARRAGERLRDAFELVDGRGAVPDIERAFRGLPEAARAYLAPLLHIPDIGITSYPVMNMHPAMPWEVMRWGWGCPQVYKTAANRGVARQALVSWGEAHGGVVVPALACFETTAPGESAAQLKGDAERVLLDDKQQCSVPGAWLWSDAALDGQERSFLRKWAEQWNW
jgi:hypothetical protein